MWWYIPLNEFCDNTKGNQMFDIDAALKDMGIDGIAQAVAPAKKQYRAPPASNASIFAAGLIDQVAKAKADAEKYPLKETRSGISGVTYTCDLPTSDKKGKPEKWYIFKDGEFRSGIYFRNQLISTKKISVTNWANLIATYEAFARSAKDGKFDADLQAIIDEAMAKREANKKAKESAS